MPTAWIDASRPADHTVRMSARWRQRSGGLIVFVGIMAVVSLFTGVSASVPRGEQFAPGPRHSASTGRHASETRAAHGAALTSSGIPASVTGPEDAHAPDHFEGTAQFEAGLLGWDPVIVVRSLLTALRSDVGLPHSMSAFVDVTDDGMTINTGLYSYAIGWDDVASVYAPDTNDPLNPRVLCVERSDGGLLVLSELALGTNTDAIVEAVNRRYPEKGMLIPR